MAEGKEMSCPMMGMMGDKTDAPKGTESPTTKPSADDSHAHHH